MSRRKLTPRTAQRALSVLDELPEALMRQVVAGLIDRLDAMEDTDADRCPVDDPDSHHAMRGHGPGDADDAEEDNEDRCAARDDEGSAYHQDDAFWGQPGNEDDAEPTLGWPERVRQGEARPTQSQLDDAEAGPDDYTARDVKAIWRGRDLAHEPVLRRGQALVQPGRWGRHGARFRFPSIGR